MSTEHLVVISRGKVETAWIGDEELERWTRTALMDQATPCEVNLRLCDRGEMREINARFARKDYATNVLAFPSDPLPGAPEPALRLLGDVLICAPVVDDEARAQDKTRRQHAAHMVIHGVLHLLGFDHQTEDEAATMEQREAALLETLQIPDPYRVLPH